MSPDPRFPLLLNALDDEGRTIYVNGRGGAYVLVPYPPGYLPPTPPVPGSYFGTTKVVDRPESMKDPLFDKHADADVYTNPEGTECLVFYARGNPPYPPCVVPCPPDLQTRVRARG